MSVEELSAYYAQLRERLNSNNFVTEWLSHRVMNVEWAISGDFFETIGTCICEIREVMAARGFEEDLLMELLLVANVGDGLRGEFMQAWNSQISLAEVHDLESLAELAVFCFSHVIYRYER